MCGYSKNIQKEEAELDPNHVNAKDLGIFWMEE